MCLLNTSVKTSKCLLSSDHHFYECSIGITQVLGARPWAFSSVGLAKCLLRLKAALPLVMLDLCSSYAFLWTHFHEETITTFTNTCHNWARWCIPVIPAVWEAAVARGQVWASPGQLSSLVRSYPQLKNIKDQEEALFQAWVLKTKASEN